MKAKELTQIICKAQKVDGIIPIKLEGLVDSLFVSYIQNEMAVTRKLYLGDFDYDYWGSLVDGSDLLNLEPDDEIEIYSRDTCLFIKSDSGSMDRQILLDTIAWNDSESDIEYPFAWEALERAQAYYDWDFYFTLDASVFSQVIDSVANAARDGEDIGDRKVFISTCGNSKIGAASTRSLTVEASSGFAAVKEMKEDAEFSIPVKLIDLVNEEDFQIVYFSFHIKHKFIYVLVRDLTIAIPWDDSPYLSSSAFGDYYVPRTAIKTKELKAAIKKVAKISSITGESALLNPVGNLVSFTSYDINRANKIAGLFIEGAAGLHYFNGTNTDDVRTSVTVCGVKLLDAIKNYPDDLSISISVVYNDKIPQIIIETVSSTIRLLGLEYEPNPPADELWSKIEHGSLIPNYEVVLREPNEDGSILEVTRQEVSILEGVIPFDDRTQYLNASKDRWPDSDQDELIKISLIDDCVDLHSPLSTLEARLMLVTDIERDSHLLDKEHSALNLLSVIRIQLEEIADKAGQDDPEVYETETGYLEDLVTKATWVGHRVNQALTKETQTLYKYTFYVE